MRIDPLLINLVSKLLGQLGEIAEEVRTTSFPVPVEQWDNRNVIDFIDQLRRATGDEYMGLAAHPCAQGASDFAIELGTRCATLREAITMGFRFMKMVTRGLVFELTEHEALATISIWQEPSDRDPAGVLSDWAMISWHKLPQWLIGAEIWLEQTEFQHALDQEYAHYAEMFGSNCLFRSKANRLVFSRSYLERRVVRLPNEGDALKATTPGYFSKPGLVAQSWTQLVRNLIRGEIAKGNPPLTVERLAAELGICSRTLRRRLEDEGVSYRGLKAETRLEVARHLVVDQNASTSDASIAAGFAEPNALSRALKARQGISGRDLRQQVLGHPGSERTD